MPTEKGTDMSEEMTPATEVSELSLDDAANALMDSWEDSASETESTETSDETATDEAIDAQADSDPEETEEEAEENESKDADEQEAADADDEQPEFKTAQDIADALDMPLDDFMAKLEATVKTSDGESSVTFDEMRRGYQREADYTRKTQELSNTRKQFEEYSSQQHQALQQQQNEAQAAMSAAQQAIMGDYQSVDWATLERDDPGQAALYKQHFQTRANGIEQARQQMMQQIQQKAEGTKAQAEQQAAHVKQREFDLLVSAIPAWVDQPTMEREGAQLSKFLMDSGYSSDELSQASDHRALHMAYRLMQLETQAAGVEKAKSKVAKAKPMLKPNSRQTESQQGNKKAKDLKSRLRKSGSLADAAKLIESTLR